MGFLAKGSNVGIVVANNGANAEAHLANDVLTPRLKALGFPVTTFSYSNILGFQGLSDVATEMSSAVLKFKSAGVNRVIFTPSASVSTLEFTTAAASQGYFPSYAGNSLESPATYLTAKEKVTAVNISWLPGRDTAPPEPSSVGASNKADAARALCNRIYAGQASPPYDFCDAMFFVQQAMAKGHGTTPAALLAGVQALGTSFQSAIGYGPTKFGKGRYDGGQEIRVMDWSNQSQAFGYAGQPVAVP
jgi:ABC-type branched-subunit amino acid transport system substrate-binding protein